MNYQTLKPHWETHSELKFNVNGAPVFISGGNGVGLTQNPAFDLVIAFEKNDVTRFSSPVYLCPITDFSVPVDHNQFLKAIKLTHLCLGNGLSVAAGCIGGHGRTGLFFAALVAYSDGSIKDPIAHVRSTYCDRAIETAEQVSWLGTYYGCPTQGHTGHKQPQEVVQVNNKARIVPRATQTRLRKSLWARLFTR